MEASTQLSPSEIGVQTEAIDFLSPFRELYVGGYKIAKLIIATNLQSVEEAKEIDLTNQKASQSSTDAFDVVIEKAKAKGKGYLRDISVKIYTQFAAIAVNDVSYDIYLATQAFVARDVWDRIKGKLSLPANFSRAEVDSLFANNKSLNDFVTNTEIRTYELTPHQDYINKENERDFQSMMKDGLMYRRGISAIIAAADKWHEMVHEADGLPLGESDWLFSTQTDRDFQKKYLDDLAAPYGLRVDYAKHPTGNEWHPFERDTSRVNYYLGDSEVPMTFEELEEWWVTEGYMIDPTLFIKTTKFEGSEMVI